MTKAFLRLWEGRCLNLPSQSAFSHSLLLWICHCFSDFISVHLRHIRNQAILDAIILIRGNLSAFYFWKRCKCKISNNSSWLGLTWIFCHLGKPSEIQVFYFVDVEAATAPERSAGACLTLITEASLLSQQQWRDVYNWDLIWTILHRTMSLWP